VHWLGLLAASVLLVALVGCQDAHKAEIRRYAQEMEEVWPGEGYYLPESLLASLQAIEPPPEMIDAHRTLYQATVTLDAARKVVNRLEEPSRHRVCVNLGYVDMPAGLPEACAAEYAAEEAWAEAKSSWGNAIGHECGFIWILEGFEGARNCH
jgi:hypothetical protein